MAGDLTISARPGAIAPDPQSLSVAPEAALFPSSAPVGATAAQTPPLVNPGLHLDLALNLVVLQFFNAQGVVTQSIPSQKQLDAYAQGAAAAHPVSRVL